MKRLKKYLNREYIEEINVELEERYYLGYFLVEENVKKYLKYSDKAGNLMIDDAIHLANNKYIFNESSINEQII